MRLILYEKLEVGRRFTGLVVYCDCKNLVRIFNGVKSQSLASRGKKSCNSFLVRIVNIIRITLVGNVAQSSDGILVVVVDELIFLKTIVFLLCQLIFCHE